MSLHLHPPIPAALEPKLLFLPLMGVSVSAGFPSPAEDWAEERVDLNQHYIHHPEATFYFTVSGDSMSSLVAERSIPDGAMLIVDRALNAKHDDIVVAVIDNDFTVKRLFCRDSRLALIPENTAYPPIVIGDEQELSIWGVVTAWIVKPR